MEKREGKGHDHLPCAEEGGSEKPNPMEETTVMSQGVISMWYCWESSKTAGMVVTGVWIYLDDDRRDKEWVEAWRGETSVLISSSDSSCQDSWEKILDEQALVNGSFTNTLFPGPQCFQGARKQQHQREHLPCAALQADAPRADGHWRGFMRLTKNTRN